MSQPFKSIPGPRALPVVGSLGPLSGDALVTLSSLAAEHGPIARFGILGRQFVLLSDPELIREVLVEKAELFPKAQRDVEILGRFLGKGLVTNNGASHRRQRKLAQPAFHHRRIQAYAETMVDYTAAHTAGWIDGAAYDIGEEMRRLTMYIVAKTLFDVDHEEIEAFAAGVGVSIHNLQQISDERFDELFSLPDWCRLRAIAWTGAAGRRSTRPWSKSLPCARRRLSTVKCRTEVTCSPCSCWRVMRRVGRWTTGSCAMR